MKHKTTKVNMSPKEKSWRLVYTDLGKVLYSGEASGITKTTDHLIVADTEKEAIRIYKWQTLLKNILGVLETK